jgi:hypothetical protein
VVMGKLVATFHGTRRSIPIVFGAKPAVINALKSSISGDEKVVPRSGMTMGTSCAPDSNPRTQRGVGEYTPKMVSGIPSRSRCEGQRLGQTASHSHEIASWVAVPA